MINQESKLVKPLFLLNVSAALIGLYLASRYSYLLFHSLVEIFSVIVACGIFIIAWNSRRIMNNNYFLLFGIASLFVGIVDLLHTLSYKGMSVFPGFGPNLATQLWIVGRYLQSFSLLAAPIFLGKKLRGGLAMALFLVTTSLLLAAVFGGVFPDCFVEGRGLTPFKKGSEYFFSIILVGSLFFMRRKSEFFEQQVMRLISCAIVLFIASELAFTVYTDVYGISNMLGHFLKLIGFFLIYKALIETGLVRPYDLIFREIKKSEEKYRTLFENMIDGFALHQIVVDESGKPIDYVFLEVNSAFEKFTGLKAKDILNKKITQTLPGIEKDTADWISVFGNVALTGKELRFEQYSELLGKWYAVMVYCPMLNHFATVFEDITKRKQGEEALRHSEMHLQIAYDELQETNEELQAQSEELQAQSEELQTQSEELEVQNQELHRAKKEWELTFDSVPDLIAIIDDSHRVVRVNKAMADRLGRAPEECLGLPCYNVVHGSNQPPMFCPHTLTLEDGKEHNIELNEGRLGGDYLVSTTPLMDQECRMIGSVHVARDITERKRADEALKKLNGELENRVKERTTELTTALKNMRAETAERLQALESLREKEQMLIQQSRQAAMGEMIGNIAHQWRQPLNTLGLFTQRLGFFYGSPQFNKEFLDSSITKSMEIIKHMSKTIDDFRDYFKPDKEKSDFNVREAIKNTLSLLEGSFQNPLISVDIVENNTPVINGYQNEFSQVLLNIMVNARDAIIERNINDARITIMMCSEDGFTVVTIADNAGGIPEEIINNVFDPYFTTKGPQQGTGVGLFMSKNIIEKNMGGRLAVRNTANGAEFRIEVLNGTPN